MRDLTPGGQQKSSPGLSQPHSTLEATDELSHRRCCFAAKTGPFFWVFGSSEERCVSDRAIVFGLVESGSEQPEGFSGHGFFREGFEQRLSRRPRAYLHSSGCR